MSRSRTIRRAPRKKKGVSFLPQSLQVFVARRLVDGLALGAMTLGGMFFVSLASYTHTDPSWNTAVTSQGAAQNWAGLPGAYAADILLQTLGGSAFVLPVVLLAWGLRLVRRDVLRPFWLRFCAAIFAAIAGSLALAQVPSGGWTVHPYLGSSAGTILMQQAIDFLPLSLGWGSGLMALTAGIIAVAALCFAAAVTRDEIEASLHTVLALAGAFVRQTGLFFAAFKDWVQHYNDPVYRTKTLKPRTRPVLLKPQQKQEAAEDDEEDEDEVEDEDEEAYEPPPLAAVKRGAASPAGGIPVVASRAPRKPLPPAQQKFQLPETEDGWEFPPLSILQTAPENSKAETVNEDALRKNAELLQNVLADFNVQGEIVSIHPGPVVTLYELEPAPGIKTSRVISLADDIARSMSAVSVRCAVVPGRNVIGIELPNKKRQTVYMSELLAYSLNESGDAKLPLLLGKDIGGQPIMADLSRMPHLLVAGTTGSGKSVAVNTMILSLLYRLPPEKCRFIMIDPKMLELSVYDDIPHLLSPVVTEPGKAVVALKWTVAEMEDRYRSMSKLGVRNIEGYNSRMREAARKGEVIMRKIQTGFDPGTGQPTFEDQPMDLSELPYIVVVVDEFADLMLVAGKDVESAIQRLAQMARAAGIHLIMATQRPSVDVITGVIKANFPTRISFQVTSKIDSRTILGEGGAEQLLGMGDMLYMAPGGRITRVHGPFVSDSDVRDVCDFLRAQAQPAYLEEITEGGDFEGSEVMNAMFGGGEGGSGVDELYDQAVALIAREGKASTSFVQRYLQIGYNRAARIIEEMERQGVISKANAVGKREVLIRDFSDV